VVVVVVVLTESLICLSRLLKCRCRCRCREWYCDTGNVSETKISKGAACSFSSIIWTVNEKSKIAIVALSLSSFWINSKVAGARPVADLFTTTQVGHHNCLYKNANLAVDNASGWSAIDYQVLCDL
jgi:hypothetical protein